jgi:hypothetical protein
MDALAITPVCLRISFSLDNLYVRLLAQRIWCIKNLLDLIY